MVFARNTIDREWMWGEHRLPMVRSYNYLGIEFACTGAWDVHIKRVIDSGRKSIFLVLEVSIVVLVDCYCL